MNKNNTPKALVLILVLVACVVLLGFTQCKKEQIEPQGGKVSITLEVSDGNGSRANVDPPHVSFVSGDRILVAYDGKYVGYLEHNGSNFSGTIDATGNNTKPLYFYFLGNCVDVSGLTAGTTTSCTANISDQTGYPALPVISFSASNENYNGAGAYTARLHNKASLMKFNVTTPSNSPICITGMNNKVIVDFSKAANDGDNNGFSYSKDSEGVIKMQGGSGSPAEKWAIVLPQDASPAARAYTSDYEYIGTRPAMEAITANQFIESGFAMEVNTVFNPYTTPLTLEAVGNGTITFNNKASGQVRVSRIYENGGSIQYIDAGGTKSIEVNAGDKVSFYGDNTTYATSTSKYTTISCTGDCYIYGNIMSLVSMYNFANSEYWTMGDYAFCQLFRGNSHIVNHPSKTLVLPATTLTQYCYRGMFRGCTGLTTAPALPATTLNDYCYYYMFNGCTSLTTAPELPATTLASHCYYYMFNGCTNLTTAPALPATTLADGCYYSMFYGCSSLTTAPALPATTLANSCYYFMFRDCTSLETAPVLPATTLTTNCYNGMFQNCTSLTTAPELPATTLVSYCYYYMFNDCTNLTSVTCLATSEINENNSTYNWLNGVAASGTFTKAAGASWPDGDNGIPSGWTTIPVVPGAFSVSSTKQVYFSQGNLKYSNGTWSFHTNQYDRCFTSVGNVSSSYNASGTFDIFGWGTSGYDHGAVCYQPWSTNTTETDYHPYGSATANLYDGDGRADWGYNAISNGGNTENQWRTLTTEEWQYLFNNHTKGWSTVNGVNGYVIRPDGVSTAVASSYTTSDWATQEAAGSLFLPAAGDRNGTTVYGVGSFGTYWSSTFYESDVKDACCMFFRSSDLGPGRYHKFLGNSVRLVRNAN